MQPIAPIYFDHQATTPIDSGVLEAMTPFLREEFGNPHSSDHILGWRASQAVDSALEKISGLIGADPDEVIFTSGATEANNLALLGLARGRHRASRRRLLVSAVEHKCVLTAARALAEREGYIVELIPVFSSGEINLDRLSGMINEDVLLVSVMAVNNEVGTIQPFREVHALCQNAGAIYHSDCAQAPYALEIGDIAKHADIISLSAHKMYGPKGIGAIYIRRDLQTSIEPIIYGGGQQRGLRSGTLPPALCVGLGAAAELAVNSIESNQPTIAERRNRFWQGLRGLGYSVHLNGPDFEKRHPGNLNVRFDGIEASELLGILQPNLAASTGAACSSGIPEPSHVLRAMGLSGDEAESSIRFSLGKATSAVDVDGAIALVGEALHKIRKGHQP
jgi:cysteine desulfurase